MQIVAGKGGVGRSTVAAALAASSAAEGKRVLAVDATGSGGLAQVMGRAGRKAGIEVLELTTRSALDDYLKVHLKLPLGPSRLGPLANIFDYVSAAAPGVRELLVIGKIGEEARSGPWDRIVVDGPATGHIVELLTAPRSMAELVPTGPLAAQTGWLGDVLASPTTTVVLVALAEELPVTETVELAERLRVETATGIGLLVVNRLPPAISTDGGAEVERLAASGSALAPVAELALARHGSATAQMARLGELGLPIVTALDRAVDPVGSVMEAMAAGPGSRWR